ncbi:hypothetical protein PVAND_016763 [Polypedilum vanderplanki]|uniref:F-box domain-containing protein n=1 Tax=Polypedilum vanderplanki TaxID=319348 RepID=A0A9J6BG31_POLVA|nr:hypothetical protein PVAND_016763 [Polypedilum vanderplanki]
MEINILNLPNEILLIIFSKADNDKNLSLVCKRFYDVVTLLNEDNLKLEIKSNFLVNSDFDFDNVLNKTSKINLQINNQEMSKNFDEKFKFFLKLYGNRVRSLSHSNTTNFLHLMPNLKEFTLIRNFDEKNSISISNRLRKNSFLLKKLTLVLPIISNWEELKVFDIEELEIHANYFILDENCLKFIANCRYLRKFKIIDYRGSSNKISFDLLSVLPLKNLESLKMSFYNLKKENVIKFLETQNNLKSLSVSYFGKSIFLAICKIFTNLNSLELEFDKNFTGKNCLKCLNLKTLKHLSIKGRRLKISDIEDLSNFYLPNLESLTLHVNVLISQKIIENFSENFNYLKSLNIEIPSICYHDILPVILKNFNKLKNLSVKTNCEIQEHKIHINENFYTTNHSNFNLKSFDLKICCYEPKKLLQKIQKDFPKLEIYPEEFLNKHFELLNEKLPFYCINLNSSVDFDKFPKDCSIKFERKFKDENFIEIARNGKNEITFNIEKYFQNEQLKAMTHTPRKLKTIKLQLKPMQDDIEIENYVNYLKVIGQHVTTLTISNKTTLYQLKEIIVAFRNLKVIKFVDILFEKLDYKILEVKNKKIKEIEMIFKLDLINENLKLLAKYFKFPEKNLESFKLKILNKNIFHVEIYKKLAEEFLINQEQITNEREKWKNEEENYEYELTKFL